MKAWRKEKKFLHIPVSVFYEHLIKSGEINKNQVSYSIINRLLKKHKLAGKNGVCQVFTGGLPHL